MASPKKKPAEQAAETTAVAAPQQRTEVVPTGDLPDLGTIAREVLTGNLQHLTEEQQAQYLAAVCVSLGLNPLTHPFAIISFKGKKTLYARRECAEQLRRIYGVSITITGQRVEGELYVVTARATLPSGRCDENIGAVTIKGYSGEDLASQIMKATTKATRRVTLGICGLGCLDESEVGDGDREPAPQARVQAAAAPARDARPAEAPEILADEDGEAVLMIGAAQIDLIDTLREACDWKESGLLKSLKTRFGVGQVRDLTSEQAEKVIAGLAGIKRAKQNDRIASLARECKFDLEPALREKFGVGQVQQLTSEQAEKVLAGLEKMAEKKTPAK